MKMKKLTLLIQDTAPNYEISIEDDHEVLIRIGEKFSTRDYSKKLPKLYNEALALAIKFISDKKMTRIGKIKHVLASHIIYEKEI